MNNDKRKQFIFDWRNGAMFSGFRGEMVKSMEKAIIFAALSAR